MNIYQGIIKEVKGNLVRVDYNQTISNFYPYLSINNSYKKHLFPPMVNEGVILFKIDSKNGFVIGSIYENKQALEGEVIEYNDGTKITYNNGELNITGLKKIILKCENVSIECKESNIKAQSAIIESNNINLGNTLSPLAGVVTGECICPYTGSPHADVSSSVKALK